MLGACAVGLTRTHPNVQTQSNGFVQLSVWGLKSRSGMHSRSAWDAHGAVCPRFVVDKRRSLCAPVSANHIKSHTECSGSPVVPGQELLFSPANLSVDARIPQSITDLVSSRNPGPRVSLSANLNLIDRRSVVSCGVSRCPERRRSLSSGTRSLCPPSPSRFRPCVLRDTCSRWRLRFSQPGSQAPGVSSPCTTRSWTTITL